MNSRHRFLPDILCALCFMGLIFTPFSLFADVDTSEIENAKTLDEAKTAYTAAVDGLSTENVDEKTVEKVISDAEAIANGAKIEIDDKYIADDTGSATPPPVDQAKVAAAQERFDAAKANENSMANKMLGGATMAATSIGAMQLAQGMTEMNADNAADAEMQSYLSTIICGIGGAKDVRYNTGGMAPEETRQLADARLKYITLAAKMKAAKENLGMAPGIESELLVDTSSLYSGRGTDQGGAGGRFDTAAERKEASDNMDKDSAKVRAIAGGAALGVGALGGMLGNELINGETAKKRAEKKELAKEKREQAKQLREDARKAKSAKERTELNERANNADNDADALEQEGEIPDITDVIEAVASTGVASDLQNVAGEAAAVVQSVGGADE